MTYRTLTQRARNVRLVILDVDGVLTDGSIWTGENGELVKRFFTRDGLGIKMLQAAGIPVAILTGRVSAQTAARCRELGITSVAQGKRFKTDAFRALLSEHNVSAEETKCAPLRTLCRTLLAATAPSEALQNSFSKPRASGTRSFLITTSGRKANEASLPG